MVFLRSLVVACVATTTRAQAPANLDQFNYRETDTSLNNDYGPEDWDQVRCLDLDECVGWPDDWEAARGWRLGQNHW